MRNLILLGSTGSIGTQTLKVAQSAGCNVFALSCNSSIDVFNAQIEHYKPSYVAVTDENSAKLVKPQPFLQEVFSGKDACVRLAELPQGDIVLNAVVGIAGLLATLAALESGKDVALANKESLVTGGKLVLEAAQRTGASLIPVDSEHSAIFQCLQNSAEKKNLKKIWLTASGGPFFGKTKDELASVTVAQALKHPNWSMGSKITIDSATLMNKGLELIEAAYLFGLDQEQINVVVHRQSIIHSMVEFCDGALLAQLGVPDMAVPIAYALTYPQRLADIAPPPDLMTANLTFAPPDEQTFCCLAAARKALALGGVAPCVVSGANEAAVELFLSEKIRFTDIGKLVTASLGVYTHYKQDFEICDVLQADKNARDFVYSLVESKGFQ